MEKKISLCVIAAAALLASNIASAAPLKASAYYSTQRPSMSLTKNAPTFPMTDITVTNASINSIYVIVPDSPIYDLVYPGTNDHIRNPDYPYSTHLVLKDPYQAVFYDNYICRLAMVTVYGAPGSYRVNIDNEYCY